MHIDVHIVWDELNRSVSFWYDPPASYWRFHQRTGEELEQELSNACRQFLHEKSDDKTRASMRAMIEANLNQWIYSGWLSLLPTPYQKE